MRNLLIALFLASAMQEEPAALLERLTDDDPAVRETAAQKLVAGYSTWRKKIEAARDAADDADLQGRLTTILADGRRHELRTTLAASIPERIRTRFPGFADALFSPDPPTRAGAFRSLQQTFNADPERHPFLGLYLTPWEMTRLLPHLRAALDPSADFADVRREWVTVLSCHDGLFALPEWIDAARELLRDPVPAVRDHALANLASKVPKPDHLAGLVRSWETLDGTARWYVLREIASRGLESEYALFEKEFQDKDGGQRATTLILQCRVAPLRTRALDFLKKNPAPFGTMIFDHLTPEEATPIVLEMLRNGAGNTADLLEVLGQRGTPEAADAAAAYLIDPDLKIRSSAVKAIGKTGGPKYAPAVAQGLREFYKGADDLGFYATPAWQLLVQWRAGDEIVGLLEFLPRINPFEVHLPGVLADLKPAGAAAKMGPHLRSGDLYHAGRALEILAALGDADEARKHLDAIRGLFAMKDGPGATVYDCVARLRLKELQSLLLDSLSSPGVTMPGRSLAQFWTLDERRAALRDPDPKVRGAAVLASGDEDLSLLEPLGRDPDATVRRRLIAMLSERHNDASGPVLLELAKEGDALQSEAAAQAFFRYPRSETKGDRLLALLRHPSRDIRVGAARYVTRDFAGRHPEVIRALLDDPLSRAKIAEYQLLLDPDHFPKHLATLEKNESAGDVLYAVIRLENEFTLEEVGTALLRLYQRVIRPDAPPIKPTTDSGFGVSVENNLERILDFSAGLAHKARGTDFAPVLLKMLASDRADVREGAATVIGRLKIAGAVPRLIELAGTPEGRRSAIALGSLNALPAALLAHQDPKVRSNAIHAATVSRDPRLFDALLAAAAGPVELQEFKDAVLALAAIAGRDRAGRLLELMKTPDVQRRSHVLFVLRRWPVPELVEPVAEFLEDNYMVRGDAAQFLKDAGGEKYAERTALAMGAYVAPVAARFGLRGHLGPSLQWLEVPGDPSMEGWAVIVARALADLGMKEHLPAVVAKLKSMKSDERRKMMLEAARLGAREAVAEELRAGAKPEYRLAAAEALFAVGAVEYRDEIRKVAAEQSANATVLIAALGDRELAERAMREADRCGNLEQALALGDRFGVAGTRTRLTQRLREQPEMVLQIIRYVWNPPPWKVADPDDYWRHRTGKALVEKIERESGRQVVFGTPPAPGFEETYWAGAGLDYLLSAMPYKASYYVDARGRFVVDTLDRCVEGWIKR
jgi:HEAT repeat protein